MNLDRFGMDTITLAGTLEQKLGAIRAAGFRQVMLSARDLTSHEGGIEAAIAAVKRSGLRVTGFQVLRDFEGLSGHLHAYKVDVAKAMLKMCHAVGARPPARVLFDVRPRHRRPGSDCERPSRSSPCSRCRSASGSRTRRCRGDVT